MIEINRSLPKNGKTCNACPSQWEFQTDDGDWLYVRYRHGAFSATRGNTINEAITGEIVKTLDYDDPFDGFMETEEMEKVLSDKVLFYGKPHNENPGTL